MSLSTSGLCGTMNGVKMAKYTRDILLESLANTIADYRQGEIDPITASHVNRWVNQFDVDDQIIILAEMDMIMKRFYFSKVQVKAHVRQFIKNEIVGKYDPVTRISQVNFLNIQTKGESQKELLKIVDEILQEDYGFTTTDVSSKELITTHVYIDDALYTGNRICYDLIEESNEHAWLRSGVQARSKLLIYTIANHLQGTNFVEKKVRPVLREKDISGTSKWSLLIDNNRIGKMEYLWPKEIVGDSIIDPYIVSVRKLLSRYNQTDYRIFRDSNVPIQETLFSSLRARDVVEKAFLKNGIRIINACREPAKPMRPLGYTAYTSLGFGTFLVTYRNIANNCPLVLWWGDRTMPSSHPFSVWYPLFPRKTNTQSSSMEYDIIVDEHPF